MGMLDGKKGIVFGIANDRSIAWHVAQSLMQHGATCGFVHLPGDKNRHRVDKALESGGVTGAWIQACDASSDADLDACFAAAKERFDNIDFLIHSIAYADRTYLKRGNFIETPRDVFAQAMDISAYTLVAMARRAKGMMSRGGSIVTMTYYGSEKVVPGYNVMGVAKAALEANVRYLAADLGQHGIRVNAVSAGPLKTLSSMAVGGVDEMFDWVEKKAPLHRNIEGADVGNTTVYLVSELSSGVTGEIIFVDAGYNTIGL
jgi:enoyl-[acyl-carrier protein] reductase I